MKKRITSLLVIAMMLALAFLPTVASAHYYKQSLVDYSPHDPYFTSWFKWVPWPNWNTYSVKIGYKPDPADHWWRAELAIYDKYNGTWRYKTSLYTGQLSATTYSKSFTGLNITTRRVNETGGGPYAAGTYNSLDLATEQCGPSGCSVTEFGAHHWLPTTIGTDHTHSSSTIDYDWMTS